MLDTMNRKEAKPAVRMSWFLRRPLWYISRIYPFLENIHPLDKKTAESLVFKTSCIRRFFSTSMLSNLWDELSNTQSTHNSSCTPIYSPPDTAHENWLLLYYKSLYVIEVTVTWKKRLIIISPRKMKKDCRCLFKCKKSLTY